MSDEITVGSLAGVDSPGDVVDSEGVKFPWNAADHVLLDVALAAVSTTSGRGCSGVVEYEEDGRPVITIRPDR